jgi:hypothetical protein
MQAVVGDEYHTARYDLLRVSKLCTPVGMSDASAGSQSTNPGPLMTMPMRNPAHHLTCYRAKLAKRVIPQDTCGVPIEGAQASKLPRQEPFIGAGSMYVHNVFGLEEVMAGGKTEICIPSVRVP